MYLNTKTKKQLHSLVTMFTYLVSVFLQSTSFAVDYTSYSDIEKVKVITEEYISQTVISNGDASVLFPESTVIIDEEGNIVSNKDFEAPTALSDKQIKGIVQYIDHLDEENIEGVYSIGGIDRINVVNSQTYKPSNAHVTLPKPAKVFNDTLTIYSSQNGVDWSYHTSINSKQYNQKSNTITFTTDHFTYFLLASELGTFVINNDAAVTTGYTVQLNTAITGAVDMKFANNYFDLASAPWEPYATNKTWNLTGGNGNKTVHAIFRDSGGITGYVSDNIFLNVGAPASGPTNISNLVAWYDANDVSTMTLNGANLLSQWDDKSGLGNHLTSPANNRRPTYQSNGLNGSGTIYFDGTDWISTTTSFTKPYTVFSVTQEASDTTGCLVCSLDPYWIFGSWFTNEDVMYAPNGWVRFPSQAPTNDVRLYSARAQGSTTRFYKDGNLLATNTANLGAIQRLQLGRLFTNNGWAREGDVSEIIIYDRELSDAESEEIECYLAAKWGLTVSHVCDTSIPPVLSNPSAITTPTTQSTNVFSFDSTKAGTITLTGACAGSLLNNQAVTGSNQITFGPLSDGIYSNCGVIVTDNVNQQSNILAINTFEIDSMLTGNTVTPTSFAGLQLWLDAADTTTLTLNGSNVTQWDDKSGNSNDVTPPLVIREPLLLSNDLNGLDTLQFGGDDSLNTASTSLVGANSDYHKFMVIKLDNSSQTNCTFGNFGGHTVYFGGTGRPILYNQGNVIQSSIDIGTTNYAIVTLNYDPSVLNSIHINGTLAASNTVTQNFTDNGEIFVGSWGNFCPLQGRIAEIGLYNQGLTDTERQNLECYLSEKRGIGVSHSCNNVLPPVLSSPGTISSSVTSSSINFSFISNRDGAITLNGDCTGLLQAPVNGLAISGANVITLGPLVNGSYNNCSIYIQDTYGLVSNVLAISAFTVQGVTGSPPVIRSGMAFSPTMLTNTAGFTFYADSPGYISMGGTCAASAVSPETALSGFNSVSFAYLDTGTYSDCTITVTNASGQVSNQLLLSPFDIIMAADLDIAAPTSLVFTGVADSVAQNLTQTSPQYFSVTDNTGLDGGWYTTLHATTLTGAGATIPPSDISVSAAGITTISGAPNPLVTVSSSLGSYQALNTPQLYIERPSGTGSGSVGLYGNQPSIRIAIPAYPNVQSYSGQILFTLYEL